MIVNNSKGKRYEITLPDGKIMKGIWFIGPQLEKLLKAYNIPYKIVKGKR